MRTRRTILQALTAGLLEAQEEERSRIARDLHDDIGQKLVALAVEVEVMRREPDCPPAEVRRRLRELQKRVEMLSEDLHRIAADLHPFALTHLGLKGALRLYCQEFSHQRHVKTRLVAHALPRTTPAAALCIYRVVQEALGNIARHAGASAAVVTISGSDSALQVDIRDDGCGFDVEQARGKGLGLISMEERVRHAGGIISIASRPGKGTCIEIRIPLAWSGPAPEAAAP